MAVAGGGFPGGGGGSNPAGVVTFAARPGPDVVPVAGDYTASLVTALGPLGADQVQQALDLIAAAGLFFTTEQFPAYALASAYSTLKSFPIAVGTTRSLVAIVLMTGGTTTAPSVASTFLLANARRSSAGVVSVNSPAPLITASPSGFNVRWSAGASTALLEFRASSAATMKTTLLYYWLEKTP